MLIPVKFWQSHDVQTKWSDKKNMLDRLKEGGYLSTLKYAKYYCQILGFY